MKNSFWIISLILIIPLVLYNCCTGFQLGLSDEKDDWKNFAEFFGGLYGPIVAGIAAYYFYESYQKQKENWEITNSSVVVDFLSKAIDEVANSIPKKFNDDYFDEIKGYINNMPDKDLGIEFNELYEELHELSYIHLKTKQIILIQNQIIKSKNSIGDIGYNFLTQKIWNQFGDKFKKIHQICLNYNAKLCQSTEDVQLQYYDNNFRGVYSHFKIFINVLADFFRNETVNKQF